MALFNWDASFDTGHALIDDQHRHLVELINLLDRSVAVNLDAKLNERLLAQLLDYTHYHFATEDRLMAELPAGAYDCEGHQQEHARFVDTLNTNRDRSDAKALLKFLVSWLVGHILKSDKALVQAMRGRIPEVDTSQSTAELQLMAALHESQTRFGELADASPALLWVSEPQGSRTFFNHAWLTYTGATLAQLGGDGWQAYIHSDDLEAYLAVYTLALENASPVEFEFRMLSAAGEYHWLREKATPRFLHEAFAGLNGSCMDVHQLKEAEQLSLRLNEELHARVRLRTQELELAQLQLLEEKDEQDKLILQLQDTQRQLVQSEKMAAIGQLAAGVAHEINNPIGYVKSNVSTLEKYVQDLVRLLGQYALLERDIAPSESLRALQALKKQVEPEYILEDLTDLVAETKQGLERVQQIVNDLKDFSRVDNTDWQMADLQRCIDATLNVVNNEIKYKAIVLREYADIPAVECLPHQLSQVFMNLLVNSAQAIPERGTITIRTRVAGDQVVIEFEDDGPGIPDKIKAEIFNPFFTTKPVGKGTGLGLSISYGIVMKHQGMIEVFDAPEKGACFRISLPLVQSKQPEASDNDALMA